MKKWRAAAAVVLFVAVFLFYWYEYRPTQIRKQCSESAANASMVYVDNNGGMDVLPKWYNERFDRCVESHGL